MVYAYLNLIFLSISNKEDGIIQFLERSSKIHRNILVYFCIDR